MRKKPGDEMEKGKKGQEHGDDNDDGEGTLLQLILEANSITVHTMLMKGVLASHNFSGEDCYPRFVDYLRKISKGKNCPIKADIILGE